MNIQPQLAVQTGIYGYGYFGHWIEDDLEAALDVARETGYSGVEVMSNLTHDPARLRGACADRGLTVTALHVFWHEADELARPELVTALGTNRLIVSSVPIEAPADVGPVVTRLDEIAEPLRSSGVQLFVHNHAEECRPMADGRTPFEALAEAMPADRLGFVIDLHWAVVGGTLARTLRALGGRCDYYHVKDGSSTDGPDTRVYNLGDGEVDLRYAAQLIDDLGGVRVAVAERAARPPDARAALDHDARYIEALWPVPAANAG